MRRLPHPAQFLAALLIPIAAAAAEPSAPDWTHVAEDSARLLSAYIRIDTQNPPGTTTEAAAFLATELARAGIRSETVAATAGKPLFRRTDSDR